MRTTILDKNMQPFLEKGYKVFVKNVGGWASFSKNSNTGKFAEKLKNNFVEDIVIVPGAKRRYMSEGTLNAVLYRADFEVHRDILYQHRIHLIFS